jgi:hypothetical protein
MKMTPEESSSQRDMRMRRVENEMFRFIDESVVLLNSGRLTLAGVKALLAEVEAATVERDEMEKTAPLELLSPLYFETSAALDTLRSHITGALARIEADSQK